MPTMTSPLSDWSGAAHLVARILVMLGLGLAALGLGRTLLLSFEHRQGIETLATIEGARLKSGGGGLVQLAWQDAAGATRRASDISVSHTVGRKLRIGNALSREKLRIRYRPTTSSSLLMRPVVVVDDVPGDVRGAASLAIAGCLAISSGSFLVLGLLLRERQRRRSSILSGSIPR